MRFWLAAVFVVLSLRGGMAADLPDTAAVVEHFQEVVFLTDEGRVHTPKPLVRWSGPVVALLDGAEAQKWRPRVEKLFRTLSKLTGLPFRIVPKGEKANMAIIFRPTADIRRITKQPGARCAGKLHGRKGEWLVRGAAVYISTDDDFRTKHCIAEEISQVLGLTNDTETPLDTIFKDSSRRTSLSLVDQILVRTLYDKRLKPGMTREEAAPISAQIITELLAKLMARPAKREKE